MGLARQGGRTDRCADPLTTPRRMSVDSGARANGGTLGTGREAVRSAGNHARRDASARNAPRTTGPPHAEPVLKQVRHTRDDCGDGRDGRDVHMETFATC